MPRIEGSYFRAWQGEGPPSSGTSGTLAGEIVPGGVYWDRDNGPTFVNEGTLASPYYTPTSYDQAGLFGINTDWRDGVGKALADTAAASILVGSGARLFGQGIEVNGDSGAVANAAGEGGTVMRLHATNEDAHTIAVGMAAGVMQPDTHKLLVVDVELSMVSAITARALFVGFLGTAADALDPAVTGATTVATLVQDDLAGLWMDAGLTDADRLFGVHNKSNADATQDLTVDGDTSTDLAAAGTFQRFRVEIAADGDMTAFVDKTQVYTQAIALDIDEECSPVVYMETLTTATITFDCRRFSTWAYR